MPSRLWKHTALCAALLMTAAGGALAGGQDDPQSGPRQLVIGDSRQNITISTDGPELTVTMTEDGKSKVTVVDLDQVGDLVGESLSGLARTLSRSQLEFRVGHDNSVSFADGSQEWTLDLNALLAEAGQALEAACADLDGRQLTPRHRARRIVRVGPEDDEIQGEMAALRSELEVLKKELARLREAQAGEDSH